MLKTFVLRTETNAQALYAFLKANWKAMAAQDKPLSVTVTEHKAKRNNPQNALYWATLREIAEQGWVGGKRYSDEAWHEMFKRKFIGLEELPDGSQSGISTTTLNVGDFADYINQIQAYAASELGIVFE